MLGSTIPIAIIGTRFAMSVEPFWTPIQFSASVPITRSFINLLLGIHRSTYRWNALRSNYLRHDCGTELYSQRVSVRLFVLTYSCFMISTHSETIEIKSRFISPLALLVLRHAGPSPFKPSNWPWLHQSTAWGTYSRSLIIKCTLPTSPVSSG